MAGTAQSFVLPLRVGGRPSEPHGAGDPVPSSLTESAVDLFRRTLVSTLRQVHKPTGALFFVSGAPPPVAGVSRIVADVAKDVVALVVPASGVLTESAEVEGPAAVAAIVWSGGKVRAAVAESGRELATSLGGGQKPGSGTLLAFCSTDGFEASEVQELANGAGTTLGAGASGSISLVEGGVARSARVGGVMLTGSAAPIVELAPACRLVSEPMVVTEMDRGLVLSLDGEPALDVLGARAGGGKHGGLILVAVHEPGDDRWVVRPLRGIDPSKRAIAVAAELTVGSRVSFAVRDPSTAREGLTEATRRAEASVRGSTPTFGLYLSCSGRGRALFGETDVDIRILKKRFPRVPIAGMHSAFEIVPWGPGEARMQLMSGVFALFRAPS
jgi:small ligand-binding sensory domain FIST